MWVTDSDPTFLPPFSPLSLSVWRSLGSSLYSDRCCICAFSVCLYCVLKGWGAELCFTWSLNPSQIKPCICGPFITIVCSLKATEWVTGTKAVRWAGFHWLASCRQPSVPPHFQYWPTLLAFISRVPTVCSAEFYHPWDNFLPPFYWRRRKLVGVRGESWRYFVCWGGEMRSVLPTEGGSSGATHHLNSPPQTELQGSSFGLLFCSSMGHRCLPEWLLFCMLIDV